MPKLRTLKICAITLLIATITAAVFVVYAFSPASYPFFDPEVRHRYFVAYQANEISKPLWFWVLTDPDEYILEAIRKSSIPEIYDPELNITWEHWTEARANETTFIYQVFFEHGEVWEIEYEGHYYCVDCLYNVDPKCDDQRIILPTIIEIHNARHEKELAMGLGSVFSVSWIAVGTLWIKKKPKHT